jgi:hypothetical protein
MDKNIKNQNCPNMSLPVLFPLIVFLSTLCCLAIFLRNARYTQQTKIFLWGISLLLDLLFLIIAPLSYRLLSPIFSLAQCFALFGNLLLLIKFGIFLHIYAQFSFVTRSFLHTIFFSVLIIWLWEWSYRGISPVQALDISALLVQIVIVGLVWMCLFDIYNKNNTNCFKIPFVWILLGNLTNSMISSILLMPQLELVFQQDMFTESIITIITGISQIVAYTCYSIGFWKSKYI